MCTTRVVQVLHVARARKVDSEAAHCTLLHCTLLRRVPRAHTHCLRPYCLHCAVSCAHWQLVPGVTPQIKQLRKAVREQLHSLINYTGPPDVPLEALPTHLRRKILACLESAPLQHERVARFRDYLLQHYIGDPAHVTGEARAPAYPATKWARVSTDERQAQSTASLTCNVVASNRR